MTALVSTANKIATLVVRILFLFNPVRIAQAMVEALNLLRRHRRLAIAMARRELSSRYAGQALGSFWVIGHPLLQMLIFLMIFAVVFKVKIDSSLEMPRDYPVYILSGLVAWLSIIPVLTAAPTSIIANTSLVKQFSFEVEVLPIKDVLIAMSFWWVGIAIVAAYTLFQYWSLPWTYLALPYVFVLHFLTMVGCAWLLSAVSVFFKDIKDIMTVLVTMGVYVLPVVYLPKWVPAVFQPFVYLNPFSSLIWVYQDTLYFGRFEHPYAWVVATSFAILVFTAGHRVFQRLRPMFGAAL